MRSHLGEEHGAAFELKRDVSFEGNAPPDAVLTHRAETSGSSEGFWCARCPGKVFVVAEKTGLSRERIARLVRDDLELQHLLAEAPDADPAELVEAYEEDKGAAELLKRHRKRARMRTARPQPAAQERREGAQAYLLAKYEEIGSVEETLWALAQLQTRDPKAYRQVMGTDQAYAVETLRKYWLEIDFDQREAAKQRYLANQQ